MRTWQSLGQITRGFVSASSRKDSYPAKRARDFVVQISSGLVSLQQALNKKPDLSIGFFWLRAKHEDSIKLLFEIPVVFTNKYKGAKKIFIDNRRLPCYLNLHQSDVIELRDAGLIQPEVQAKFLRITIDYPALAQE
ncbi:MAG: hypothetical protein NTV54_11280 [Ignavibacteriales bacterium]|nr:hypothetical protein [Ignavibacteriales bacterium]